MDKITRYWIDTSSKYKSAIKSVHTKEDVKMTLYNQKYPLGTEVQSSMFFKIAVGQNSDYDLVEFSKFKKYIEDMRK